MHMPFLALEIGFELLALFVIREPSRRLGREMISEQLAVFRIADGRIVSVVGYYDSAEFRRLFWEDGV